MNKSQLKASVVISTPCRQTTCRKPENPAGTKPEEIPQRQIGGTPHKSAVPFPVNLSPTTKIRRWKCVCVCALRCGVKIKVIQTSGLRFEMKFADRPTQSSPAQSSALTASTCGNFWKVYTPQCCANGTPIGQLLAWSIWSFAECLDAMTTDWWTSSISFSVFSFSFLNWNGRVPGRCPQTITVLLATHFRGHLCFHSPLLRLLCFCWVEGMSSWTRSLYETRG